MGFKKEYRTKSGAEHRSCLSFFGYSYRAQSDTYYSQKPTTYSVRSVSDTTVEISKNPTSYSKSTSEYGEYYRYEEPSGREKELEDRFYEYAEDKYSEPSMWNDGTTYFDVTKTPYFCKSVRDYFYDGRLFLLEWLALLVGIAFVLTISIWMGSKVYAFGKDGLIGGILAGIGIAIPCSFPAIALFFIAKLVSNIIDALLSLIKFGAYDRLFKRGKRKMREKYLASLTIGIPEADEILREYAILKGYDKI